MPRKPKKSVTGRPTAVLRMSVESLYRYPSVPKRKPPKKKTPKRAKKGR